MSTPDRYHPEGLRPPTPSWNELHPKAGPSELLLRAIAFPAALLLALLFHALPIGHFWQRACFSMPLHELGHAVTAWLCGTFAVPFLWQTYFGEGRSWLLILLLAGGLTWLSISAYRARLWSGGAALAILLLVQLYCTLLLSRRSAEALMIFGGDGGALVLGTVAMGSFYFGRATQLYRGKLRWGFVVIGAAAFVDTFTLWWRARRDDDVIPFGEIEGVGLSDPSKLVELHGWSVRLLVHRYVALGSVCLVVLLGLWVWGLYDARRAAGPTPATVR